jgi:hypothetical protein
LAHTARRTQHGFSPAKSNGGSWHTSARQHGTTSQLSAANTKIFPHTKEAKIRRQLSYNLIKYKEGKLTLQTI